MEAENSSIFASQDSGSDKPKRITPFNPICNEISEELISPAQKTREGFHIDQKQVLPSIMNNQADNGMVTTIHRKLLYHILENEPRAYSNKSGASQMDIEQSKGERDNARSSIDVSLGRGSMSNELDEFSNLHNFSEPTLMRNSSLSPCSGYNDLALHKHMSLNLDMDDQINHTTAKWIAEHPTPGSILATSNKELLIFDCRFTFEYLGGHIQGALNINKPSLVEFLFVKCPNHIFNRHFLQELRKLTGKLVNMDDLQALVHRFPNPLRDCIPVVVFHCEFSYCRAPEMWKFLRKKDRNDLGNCHPNLTYPQIYLLKEGYSKFFKERNDLCATDSKYIMMNDARYENIKIEETRALSDDWAMTEGSNSRSSKRSKRFLRF
jgi:rhodanese-related sulfurtransferase